MDGLCGSLSAWGWCEFVVSQTEKWIHINAKHFFKSLAVFGKTLNLINLPQMTTRILLMIKSIHVLPGVLSLTAHLSFSWSFSKVIMLNWWLHNHFFGKRLISQAQRKRTLTYTQLSSIMGVGRTEYYGQSKSLFFLELFSLSHPAPCAQVSKPCFECASCCRSIT